MTDVKDLINKLAMQSGKMQEVSKEAAANIARIAEAAEEAAKILQAGKALPFLKK